MTTKPTSENSGLPLTVQDAVYQTVHQTPGRPPKAIAQDANIPISALYEYADEFRTDRKLKAEELPALVKASGNTVILDVLEAAIGRVAFRVPAITNTASEQVQLSREAIREFSEALDAWCTAVDDGQVTPAEARRFMAQGGEAIAAIARMVEYAKTVTKAAPSALRQVKP